MERLTKQLDDPKTSLVESTQKEAVINAASLRAQIPSVASFPCSPDHLLDGLLGKIAPSLVGAHECETLRCELGHAATVE